MWAAVEEGTDSASAHFKWRGWAEVKKGTD